MTRHGSVIFVEKRRFWVREIQDLKSGLIVDWIRVTAARKANEVSVFVLSGWGSKIKWILNKEREIKTEKTEEKEWVKDKNKNLTVFKSCKKWKVRTNEQKKKRRKKNDKKWKVTEINKEET